MSKMLSAKHPDPMRVQGAEFCSKLDGLLQEADESQLWLELLHEDCGIEGDRMNTLLAETNELIAIFVTIVNRTKGNG